MKRSRIVALSLVAFLGLSALAGCNGLVGDQDVELAPSDGSAEDGTVAAEGGRDSSSGVDATADGKAGGDAGPGGDGTAPGDGPATGDAPGDAAPEAAPCGPTTCANGCCSAAGACVTTASNGNCGKGGTLCAVCGTGAECNATGTACTCDATSCPGGCCDGLTCVPQTAQDAGTCGASGNACGKCAAGQACQNGGCSCGGGSCTTGCCSQAGQCVTSNTTTCGVGGVSCVTCGSGQECTAQGACTCDATSCPNGCCLGGPTGTCELYGSQSITSCGAAGATCAPCGSGKECNGSGACVCDSISCAGGCCVGGPTGSCELYANQLPTSCGSGGATCKDCGSGLTCSAAGACVCNATSCATGCCAGGTCQVQAPAACGTAGATTCTDCTTKILHATAICTTGATCDYSACATGYADLDGNRANGCETVNPLGTPEGQGGQLLLWLRADTGYASGTWTDQSGKHANGTCTGAACPLVNVDGNGHKSLHFDGSTKSIQLTDPGGQYDSFNPTIFVVGIPLGTSQAGANLIRFSDSSGVNTVTLQRDATNTSSMDFHETTSSTSPSIAEGQAWAGDMEILVASIDVTGLGSFSFYTQGTQVAGIVGQLGFPPTATRTASWIGSNGSTAGFAGEVYEVVVFTGAMSQTSLTNVQNYLNTYYGGISARPRLRRDDPQLARVLDAAAADGPLGHRDGAGPTRRSPRQRAGQRGLRGALEELEVVPGLELERELLPGAPCARTRRRAACTLLDEHVVLRVALRGLG